MWTLGIYYAEVLPTYGIGLISTKAEYAERSGLASRLFLPKHSIPEMSMSDETRLVNNENLLIANTIHLVFSRFVLRFVRK